MGYDDCSAEDLAEGVYAKYITPEEFQEITGETYENYKMLCHKPNGFLFVILINQKRRTMKKHSFEFPADQLGGAVKAYRGNKTIMSHRLLICPEWESFLPIRR